VRVRGRKHISTGGKVNKDNRWWMKIYVETTLKVKTSGGFHVPITNSLTHSGVRFTLTRARISDLLAS
jgi:hypothetical protein